MLGAVLPSLISAGSKLIGGLFGSREAEEQADLQKKFAQNAIQWKVADARKAGISPLYALGAQTVSYQPNLVGGGMSTAVSDMGQDISRAVEAVSSAGERTFNKTLSALQLERAGLENDLLRSQIAKNTMSGQVGPAMPAVVAEEKVQPPQRTPHVYVGGTKLKLDPGTSDVGQLAEDRYGEGPASWVTGIAGMVNDAIYNLKDKTFFEILDTIDRATRVNKYWE